MRSSREGDCLHSKTDNCTRSPYFSQIWATRFSRTAPSSFVSAMS